MGDEDPAHGVTKWLQVARSKRELDRIETTYDGESQGTSQKAVKVVLGRRLGSR